MKGAEWDLAKTLSDYSFDHSVRGACRVSVRVRRASGGHRDRRDRCSDSDRHTRSCSEPDSYADTRSGFQRKLCSYFYAENLVCSASHLRLHAERKREYAYAVPGVGFAVSFS